jgi:hypothetical protein
MALLRDMTSEIGELTPNHDSWPVSHAEASFCQRLPDFFWLEATRPEVRMEWVWLTVVEASTRRLQAGISFLAWAPRWIGMPNDRDPTEGSMPRLPDPVLLHFAGFLLPKFEAAIPVPLSEQWVHLADTALRLRPRGHYHIRQCLVDDMRRLHCIRSWIEGRLPHARRRIAVGRRIVSMLAARGGVDIEPLIAELLELLATFPLDRVPVSERMPFREEDHLHG